MDLKEFIEVCEVKAAGRKLEKMNAFIAAGNKLNIATVNSDGSLVGIVKMSNSG